MSDVKNLIKEYKKFLQKLKKFSTPKKIKKYSSVYGKITGRNYKDYSKLTGRKYKEYILPYQFTKKEIAKIYNLRTPVYLDVRITIEEQLKILRELLKIPIGKSDKLLSLGSGAGVLEVFLAKEIVPEGEVIGIDISTNLVKLAQDIAKKEKVDNVRFFLQDMEKMKFELGSFNLIFSFDVLHWVKNLEKVFTKVKKILKKNGYFLFTYEPAASYMKEKELVEKLKEIGFKNIILEHIKFKHPNPALPYYKKQLAIRPLIKAKK